MQLSENTSVLVTMGALEVNWFHCCYLYMCVITNILWTGALSTRGLPMGKQLSLILLFLPQG